MPSATGCAISATANARTSQSTMPMATGCPNGSPRILAGAKPAIDQSRADHQPQDREGARPHRAAAAARPRRRGDRVRRAYCALTAINGTSGKSAKSKLVPLAGLEPARCCHHLILSQARLPIPPQGLDRCDHSGEALGVNGPHIIAAFASLYGAKVDGDNVDREQATPA